MKNSCHLSTSWHRATGDKYCHTLLCFGSTFSIQSPTWHWYFSVFFSTLLSFLFPPPQKAANQKASSYYKSHLLISCTGKRYNTFLMSHSDNKSCVSSPQSRVWRVQGAVAPQLLLSALLGYRAWGGLYPNQHKWVSHKGSVFQATCLQHFSNESAFPQRKSASVWFIFSIACLLDYLFKAT